MKKLLLILAIVLLLAGVGLLLFPTVSNFAGTKISQAQTDKYEERLKHVVPGMTRDDAVKQGIINEKGEYIKGTNSGQSSGGNSDDNGGEVVEYYEYEVYDSPVLFELDLDRLYSDCLKYNADIRENQSSLLIDEDAYQEPVIDLSKYGIYDDVFGYVSIPSIDMRLPIYLGANGENMSYGAAHMTYTTLPMGEKRSNCVLAGHTDYIGRIFFDNLRRLSPGDEVYIRNFWDNFSYRVIDTAVYAPDQSQAIYISDDRDLLTMFTCIPDGNGDFNRFFVICERVADQASDPSPGSEKP